MSIRSLPYVTTAFFLKINQHDAFGISENFSHPGMQKIQKALLGFLFQEENEVLGK